MMVFLAVVGLVSAAPIPVLSFTQVADGVSFACSRG